MDKSTLAELTAEVVKSYVGGAARSQDDLNRAIEQLPILIDRVHEALAKILEDRRRDTADNLVTVTQHLARPIEKTIPSARPAAVEPIADDHLICLEDGKSFKTLGRHLHSVHGLTPGEYRAKWGLPDDYPMACPSYARSRSNVAKKIGLGLNGRGSAPANLSRSPKRRGAPKSKPR